MTELRKPLLGLLAAFIALAGAIVLHTRTQPDGEDVATVAAASPPA